jgi:hypothetical protein
MALSVDGGTAFTLCEALYPTHGSKVDYNLDVQLGIVDLQSKSCIE